MIGTVRHRMMADHAELESLFQDVAAAFALDDREVAAEAFTRLEHRLRAHLAFEEHTLVPLIARAHPAEAAAISADHRKIRARLDELGIGIDLHATRAGAMSAFIDALRAHAKREDAGLYRWADDARESLACEARVGQTGR